MDASSDPSIVFRSSPIHGTGAFATRPIQAGERLIEYIGRRIAKAESHAQLEQGNEYIFELDDQWDVDGNVDWNPARWINHSCQPNAEAQIEDDHIWIVATRNIPPGEEVTFNYNFDLESYGEHPCRCGAPECVGYMVAEEHFPHVRRMHALRPETSDATASPDSPPRIQSAITTSHDGQAPGQPVPRPNP